MVPILFIPLMFLFTEDSTGSRSSDTWLYTYTTSTFVICVRFVCFRNTHQTACKFYSQSICLFCNETNLRSICYGQHFRRVVVPQTRMLTLNVNFVASDQLTPSCVCGVLCAWTPLQSGNAVTCFCSQDWQSKDWANIVAASTQHSKAVCRFAGAATETKHTSHYTMLCK